jgi:branched-chain amino acid transport system ATP-binding protein
MLLEVQDLDIRYGRIRAISQLGMTCNEGEIVGVLGANGAGKSSLLKTILGIVKPKSGRIAFLGEDIKGWPASKRVRNGLVMVPEGRRILVSLTVHENLLMGSLYRKDKDGVEKDLDDIYERFPSLQGRRDLMASVLSGGEQQMLAIGRALLARPKLMMLDEPSLGLSPLLVKELFSLIRDLNQEGLSILLVEQNVHMALSTAHRAYVLELGNLVMEGTPEVLLADEALHEAYLGKFD